MATVQVVIGPAMGGGAPVLAPVPYASQTVTSTGTSQQTTISGRSGDYASITAVDGAVHVSIGANPTAAASVGDIVAAGGFKTYGPLSDGDLIAIKDV